MDPTSEQPAAPAGLAHYERRHKGFVHWMNGLRKKALEGGAKSFFTTDLDDRDWKGYLDSREELVAMEEKLGLKPSERKAIPPFSDPIPKSLHGKTDKPLLTEDDLFRQD